MYTTAVLLLDIVPGSNYPDTGRGKWSVLNANDVPVPVFEYECMTHRVHPRASVESEDETKSIELIENYYA